MGYRREAAAERYALTFRGGICACLRAHDPPSHRIGSYDSNRAETAPHSPRCSVQFPHRVFHLHHRLLDVVLHAIQERPLVND